MANPVTATPHIVRTSIANETTSAILGSLSGEATGTLVYVYLNFKRAGTCAIAPNGQWTMPVSQLSFGGGPQQLKSGDTIYAQARAIGKSVSEPTPVYTINGIDQPMAPYVQDELTGGPREIFERDTLIQGDVPLLRDYTQPLGSDGECPQVLFSADPDAGIVEGATVSVYLDGSFLTTVQTSPVGHWHLDLNTLDPLQHPLLPLKKTQTLSYRAERIRIDPGTGAVEFLVQPSVESPKASVKSGYFERRLFDFYPAQWKVDDADQGANSLRQYTKVLALTMDEVKSYVDEFPRIFDIDRCDPKHFEGIAALLGYPLNRLDSIESQRFQIRNAIQFWKRKGTAEVFRILFYLLDYNISIVELWTEDYQTFYPGIMDFVPSPPVDKYPKATYPFGPPNDAPELFENGGTWYKSPYFGIELEPSNTSGPTPSHSNGRVYCSDPATDHLGYFTDTTYCPMETTGTVSFSIEDLHYLLERIDLFRPAHTVLDYIRFNLTLDECGPLPDDCLRWLVELYFEEQGWYNGYCDPDDPYYYRRGHLIDPNEVIMVEDPPGNVHAIPWGDGSTRPDKLGLVDLGVTRRPLAPPATTVIEDPPAVFTVVAGSVNAPPSPMIRMRRDPQPGLCHPIEEFWWDAAPFEDEYYTGYINRSGMDVGFYPYQEPVTQVDPSDWPSRDPLSGIPDPAILVWAAGVPVLAGDMVIPSVDNGFYYVALNNGTTDLVEPTWVADNSPYSGIPAQGTITMSGTPILNETFTIDTQVFTWKALRGALGEVTIDANPTTAAANIALAVNSDLATVYAQAVGPIVYITAAAIGSLGNTVVFTEASTGMAVDGAGTLGGTTVGVDFGVTVDNDVIWKAQTNYPDRTGKYRYIERLYMHLEAYVGP